MRQRRKSWKKDYNIQGENMVLTPRLAKIASLVPRGSILADIGTDHGYIPCYCVKNNICPRALAMDINQGPLDNARDTVKNEGLEDLVLLRLSDGMNKLDYGEADTVVIAGMGGLLIRSILESDKDKLKDGTYLILQPMLAQKELRQYLYDNDMSVENEYLETEGNKIYNIILARKGNKHKPAPSDIIIGRNIRKNSMDIYEKYINREISIRNKILSGLCRASVKDAKAIETVQYELEMFIQGGEEK